MTLTLCNEFANFNHYVTVPLNTKGTVNHEYGLYECFHNSMRPVCLSTRRRIASFYIGMLKQEGTKEWWLDQLTQFSIPN